MSIKFHGFLSAEYNMLGIPLFRKLRSVELVLFKKICVFSNLSTGQYHLSVQILPQCHSMMFLCDASLNIEH